MMLDRTIAPPIRQIDHFTIPAPARQLLRNGIPLNVLQVGDEDVVRFDLLLRGGQWNQTQPLQALLANRMLREGTRQFSSSQIAEKLDYYGAWLDLSSSINYGFVTLYSLGKYFPKTMEIVASLVKEPTFPQKELDVVLNTNKQQYLINAERTDVIARKCLNRALFGTAHPLGRYAELDDYEKITPEILRRFYEHHYHSGNCSMYVSGKVTPEIIRCIEQNLGNEAWGNVTCQTIDGNYVPVTTQQKRIFVEKENAMQSSVRIGGFSIRQQHPDYLKLRVLVTLFGGYFGSRLMGNIREEKGYTYGIGSSLISYPNTSILAISTEAANEYVEPLITEVYKEMDKLCNESIPREELEMVKNYMLGEMCRSYESAFSLPDAWIYMETAGLAKDYLDCAAQAIQEVTASELQELARRYFCKENLIEVVAGKKV